LNLSFFFYPSILLIGTALLLTKKKSFLFPSAFNIMLKFFPFFEIVVAAAVASALAFAVDVCLSLARVLAPALASRAPVAVPLTLSLRNICRSDSRTH